MRPCERLRLARQSQGGWAAARKRTAVGWLGVARRCECSAGAVVCCRPTRWRSPRTCCGGIWRPRGRQDGFPRFPDPGLAGYRRSLLCVGVAGMGVKPSNLPNASWLASSPGQKSEARSPHVGCCCVTRPSPIPRPTKPYGGGPAVARKRHSFVAGTRFCSVLGMWRTAVARDGIPSTMTWWRWPNPLVAGVDGIWLGAAVPVHHGGDGGGRREMDL